jgi:hypothetical protein
VEVADGTAAKPQAETANARKVTSTIKFFIFSPLRSPEFKVFLKTDQNHGQDIAKASQQD